MDAKYRRLVPLSGLTPEKVEASLEVVHGFDTVKAVSELYAPVSGEVVEVNTALKEKPESVNANPHSSWMIVVTKPGAIVSKRSLR